jgi:hypothetical protein
MNRNNGHDWGSIFVLWSCMFTATVITTGWLTDSLEPLFSAIIFLTVASVGAELVGRK